MTLHEAIERLLKQKGRPMTTSEIALELNKNKWYRKKDGSEIQAFQIHGRTRNYSSLFERNGSTVSLIGKPINMSNANTTTRSQPRTVKQNKKTDSDENYILNLCDKVLKMQSLRQHKFDFLRGDENSQGKSVRLPVDAYYPDINLVVEYRERQHTEEVTFFDKPNKLTVSGVSRGEQRKIYDQRRRDVLPKHGIQLIEISYSDFHFNNQKRIIRSENKDIEIVKRKITVANKTYT